MLNKSAKRSDRCPASGSGVKRFDTVFPQGHSGSFVRLLRFSCQFWGVGL